MAKKKVVSKNKKAKVKAKKVVKEKVKPKKKKIDLSELSDKIYRYDNEEKLDEFFNKNHPPENFEDPEFDDEDEENEYFEEHLTADSRRIDAVFDDYLELIEEILENPEMELHKELKSLDKEEMQILKDNLYSEVDAGVN